MTLRTTIFWILLGAILVAALLHLAEIQKVFLLIRSLRWEWVGLAVAAQAATYVTTVWALGGLLAALGYTFPWRSLWRAAVVFVLGWQTVPAGGVGGLVFWSAALGRKGVPASAAVASGVVYTVLDYLAFLILLATGTLILWVEQALPRTLVLTLTLAGIVILAGIGTVAALLWTEARGLALIARAAARVNGAFGRIGLPLLDIERLLEAGRVLFGAVRALEHEPGRALPPLFNTLLARVFDVLTLQVLFVAVGHPLTWGATTLGFVYASFVSFLSFLPTGLGVIEASLALVYAGMGVPLGVAVVVILIYRALAYWLPIPYGLFLYHRVLAPPAQEAPG